MTRRRISQNEKWERERVGATVKALREAKGFTPDGFATEIPISRAYLANIEAGRKPLTERLWREFAAALIVPPLALIHPSYFDSDAGDA